MFVKAYGVVAAYFVQHSPHIDSTICLSNALGVAYAYGLGTEQDIELGRENLEAAAKLGSETAKENLQYLEQQGKKRKIDD